MIPPSADPNTILGATNFMRPQSTAPLKLCEKVEDNELKTITPSELPRTICDRIWSGNCR